MRTRHTKWTVRYQDSKGARWKFYGRGYSKRTADEIMKALIWAGSYAAETKLEPLAGPARE
jgi:hypothetical protein